MNESKKNYNFALFFIVFLTSFTLWYFTSFYNKVELSLQEKNKTLVETINNKIIESKIQLDSFYKVYDIVEKNYYSSDELKQKDLEYWIITWFINSLWDKFSEFMIPEDNKQFQDALNWNFEWIWAVIEKNELWVIVDRVIKWSPAINNWIIKWDIIIEANANKLQDLTVSEAVNHIKWPAWTKVSLKIIRAWESDFITKEIIRDKIKIPSVDTLDMKDEEIWYISLNIFGETTSIEFNELLNTFNNDKVKWVILDLRDNWWGYLQSAVEILSNFIEKWKLLVTTKYKDSVLNNYYYSENFWKIFGKKVVILINWNSASASEITAGALKDYNKAILVWEKSYWKWSVQEPFNLPDGSMLKLTIAKWYTPKDYSIDQNGIEPDIKISFKKEDYENKYDRQLEEAKKILKSFIKLDNIALTIEEYKKENPESFGTWWLVWSWILNGSWSEVK